MVLCNVIGGAQDDCASSKFIALFSRCISFDSDVSNRPTMKQLEATGERQVPPMTFIHQQHQDCRAINKSNHSFWRLCCCNQSLGDIRDPFDNVTFRRFAIEIIDCDENKIEKCKGSRLNRLHSVQVQLINAKTNAHLFQVYGKT
jgi:hypothetical protein